VFEDVYKILNRPNQFHSVTKRARKTFIANSRRSVLINKVAEWMSGSLLDEQDLSLILYFSFSAIE
jgi:hypothetical protein